MIDDTIKTIEPENASVEEPKELPVKEPEIVDVDLGFVEKRKFRIAGDFNRILELNVSDLNVATRLNEGYPKLKKLLAEAQAKIESIPEDAEEVELLNQLANSLIEIDREMRSVIDFIFDANVSETCAPSGNMYDPVGGQFRFERILDIVTGLYTNGLNAEFQKVKERVEKKAVKYTGKKRK